MVRLKVDSGSEVRGSAVDTLRHTQKVGGAFGSLARSLADACVPPTK
jgi:hypothetical protein